ncbi:MAG: hypothetical protein ACD_7C00029G0004 [uncultured bacterium]|nr:MAG: hypothetical protein ACD_7C00029G0004 [uncultured bacterium]KKP69016.1 MAG: hypothetical protein UR66_C0002G0073 [Candidatus Moranbacteria bacterium GW2011_GWE1_35_17]KKP74390.1 MAG: hypothetical protein UR65_C0001G0007 [Candidatus Moranbacteria bacterium GW2011_GWE2_35_164]KKP84436.1 MAG: hypothetical protein UR82_C0006G0002 [Candidatus Moranbacteria bacterium GW2011_GWF1_35_5]KKP85299.1 MAG: hypothetical protein UR83_C0001G0006 [Candidatus Moranbacteria bacterium GW2011_GWF2_35_54]
MNDESHNNQNNIEEQSDEMQTSVCNVCKNDPCICTDNDKKYGSNPSKENDKKPTRIKPPKISWI